MMIRQIIANKSVQAKHLKNQRKIMLSFAIVKKKKVFMKQTLDKLQIRKIPSFLSIFSLQLKNKI